MNRARTAFTLLELMISILITSVLLTALWSLLGMYRNQYDKSQQRVERWQLVRSLQSVLEDDLMAVARNAPQQNSDNEPSSNATTSDRLLPFESQQPAMADQAALDQAALGQAALGQLESDYSAGDVSAHQPSAMRHASQWWRPDVKVVGNEHFLVIDRSAPVQAPEAWQQVGRFPPQPSPSFSASPGTSTRFAPGMQRPDQAAWGAALPLADGSRAGGQLADTRRRVVYIFVDSDTARRTGAPTGLLRCDLKRQEWLTLAQLGGESWNLFDLLGDLLPTGSPPGGRPAIKETTQAMPLPSGPPGSAAAGPAAPAAGNEVGALSYRPPHAALLPDIAMRVEHLPEVTGWQMSYYDGHQWYWQWPPPDERASLPVALYVQFDIRSIGEPHSEATPSDLRRVEPSGTRSGSRSSDSSLGPMTRPLGPAHLIGSASLRAAPSGPSTRAGGPGVDGGRFSSPGYQLELVFSLSSPPGNSVAPWQNGASTPDNRFPNSP